VDYPGERTLVPLRLAPRLEVHTKAEASHAAEARSKLKADQEAYRVNLWKVFN